MKNELSINMSSELTAKSQPTRRKKPRLTKTELPETGEVEIHKEATPKTPEKRVRFPRESFKHFRQPPKKFKESRDAIKEWNKQNRIEQAVYPNSLEVQIGYDSLFRIMREYLSEQIAYFRSQEGGMLSIEEASERVYGAELLDEEFFRQKFDNVIAKRIDTISFNDLWYLARDSPGVAQNIWELIKRDARGEFLSGHFAAESLEPLEKIKTAWVRAKFISIRECFITQWKPNNSIEANVIDTIAQSWFLLQHWTKVLSTRSQTEARLDPFEYQRWKEANRRRNPRAWKEEKWHWEIPTIRESEALDQAAQMIDRFHKMYCRSIRLLQSLRKSCPQVTINNPQQVNMGEQVNIASDGAQQMNIASSDKK
ncbi:MAG TPA: hypothetical protein VF648_05885 [Pyrinomonadaceae bacterium]|jgi:hypothetical protein